MEVIDAFSDNEKKFFQAIGEGSSDQLPDRRNHNSDSESSESEDESKTPEPFLCKVTSSGALEVARGSNLSQALLDPTVSIFYFR